MSEFRATVWDLDTDEIASIASDDLFENRPNRWRGPESTWRTLTEPESLLWQSMKQLRDADLAVHLYNAFALKRKAARPETARDLLVDTGNGQDVVWAPSKMWTAWPLSEKHLPPGGLFKTAEDEDEQYTYRKEEDVSMPSSELQEELTATIMRLAKQRFVKRKLNLENSDTAGDAVPSQRPSPTAMDSSTSEGEPEDEDEMQIDGESASANTTVIEEPITYVPTFSADDERSSNLLRLPVRHILLQLDMTLKILHNSRTAGTHNLSESSDTDVDAESHLAPPELRKRSRGRPRLPREPSKDSIPATDSSTDNEAGESTGKKRRRRGRPKQTQEPLEGELEEDMRARLARKGHRRLPYTEKEKKAAFEEWLRRGDSKAQQDEEDHLREPSQNSEVSENSGSRSPSQSASNQRLDRWGLRDWSDVVGAAALAGFSDDVIRRTAKRCADLFGESMTINQLSEVPASKSSGVQQATYHPEPIRVTPSIVDSSSEDDIDDEAILAQRRIASRQASLAAHSRGSSMRGRGSSRSPSTGRQRSASQSRSQSQSQSRSQSRMPSRPSDRKSGSRSRSRSRSQSSAGLTFCPIISCERAATGFSRRANLRRHMQLVHADFSFSEEAIGAADTEDSEDEVHGAVHVDGFLRTIKISKGWRGEDILPRKSRLVTRQGTPLRNARWSTRNTEDTDEYVEDSDE